MSPRERAILVSALLCAALALAAGLGAGELEHRIFEEGSRAGRGKDYVHARDILVREGRGLLPFLTGKQKSEEWRERIFARILRLRIKEPDKVKKWEKALAAPFREYKVKRAFMQYRYDAKTDSFALGTNWGILPQKPVGAPPELQIDLMRARGGGSSDGDLAHLGATMEFALAPTVDVAEEILTSRQYFRRELVIKGMTKLGDRMHPRLRKELTSGSSSRRELIAVHVLSRQRDQQAVPLIVGRLGRAQKGGDYIQGLSEALSHMKALEGLDAILDHLTLAAHLQKKRPWGGSSDYPRYHVLRGHVVGYGRAALPHLRKRLEAAKNEGDRIVLASLITELSGVTGKERDVAALRESEWLLPTPEGLLELHRSGGDDVLGRLRGFAKGFSGSSWSGLWGDPDKARAALLALGELGDPGALSFLVERVADMHKSLESIRKRSARTEATKPFDPQAIREAAFTFGRYDRKMGVVLSVGDAALLAIRRIGGDEAKRRLAALAEYPEYRTRAQTSVLLLEGRLDELAKRLASKDRALREEAALALFDAKDAKATHELLRAATRRHGPSHEEWKGYVLASRKDVRPLLRNSLGAGSVRERVLAEALLIELDEPKRTERLRVALNAAAESVSMMHVWGIGNVESAGRSLVKKAEWRAEDDRWSRRPKDGEWVQYTRYWDRRWGKFQGVLGADDIALLESTCLFGQGILRRGMAAFALAELKRPRSLKALAESLNMGSLGGSNPAALALATFGKEGAELAAKVPPPVAGEFDTGIRMTQHRGGVRVLSENKDIRGVDEILKGLDTLAKDRELDLWGHRAGIYLSAAAKYHDERLVEPLLRILNTAERPENSHHWSVIKLLAAYDDKRLPGLFLKRLATLSLDGGDLHQGDCLHEVAVEGLTRVLGEGAPAFLIEQFGKSRDTKLRCGILLALAELSYPEYPAYPGKARWSRERFKDPKERVALASKTRELAFPVIVKALDYPSATTSLLAAKSLVAWGRGNNIGIDVPPDKRAVKPFNDWCRSKGACFYSGTKFLTENGDKESGQILLGILKANPFDGHVAHAVAKMKPRGAVPVLVHRVWRCHERYRPEKRYVQTTGVDQLAEFGEEGAAALMSILRKARHLPFKVGCARLLGKLEHKAAADPVERLLRDTIQRGIMNAELRAGAQEKEKERAYIRICSTLLKSLGKIEAGRATRIAKEILLDGPKLLRPAALEALSASEKD